MQKNKTYKEMTNDYLTTRTDAAFTVLYNRIKPGLTSHINKVVKDWDIAEDLAVNTLTKMFTKIDQYNPEYQITTWLYKIGFNAALGYLNERNKTQSLTALQDFGIEVNNSGSTNHDMDVEEELSFDDLTDEDNMFQMKYDMTVEAIKDLKPMYRDLLVDRMLNGIKYKDLAVKHNLPLQTVKNRVRRGKVLISEAVESQIMVA